MKENEMNSKNKEKNISEHQQHINQVKENAEKIINAGTSALTKERQLAIKEREQIIANKLHYMKSLLL